MSLDDLDDSYESATSSRTGSSEPKKSTKQTIEQQQQRKKRRRLIANFDQTRQEEIREANRLAARICRKRKKQFAQDLEATLKVLDVENQELATQYETLSVWLTQINMTRREAEKCTTTPSTSDTEKKSISDPGKQAEAFLVNCSDDYAEEDTEKPSSNSQFLASASASTSPFPQQDYTNGGATTGGIAAPSGGGSTSQPNQGYTWPSVPTGGATTGGTSTNSSSNDTSDNMAQRAQPGTGLPPMYNAPFLNHRIDQPQHPTPALLALQQQQQQQQNFQQYGTSALIPPEGMFGINTSTSLPVSTMAHHQMQNMYAANSNQIHNPAGVSVGTLPGQFSRMMAMPNPQNDATMQQQEQLSALTLARNQGLAMSQLLMQNPCLMVGGGGWNGMNSGRIQFPQQGIAAPSGGGSTSQPNQGYTWPTVPSHNHQQL